jgi:hypothetical protein
MRRDTFTDTPARPLTLDELRARAEGARNARDCAWERVVKARAALCAALDSFHDAMGHQTAAFLALGDALAGRTAEPAPPAPETLTGADEVD